jgi:hypothetical protein
MKAWLISFGILVVMALDIYSYKDEHIRIWIGIALAMLATKIYIEDKLK